MARASGAAYRGTQQERALHEFAATCAAPARAGVARVNGLACTPVWRTPRAAFGVPPRPPPGVDGACAHPTHPAAPTQDIPFNTSVTIKDLGSPEVLISGFAPELYGEPLGEEDILDVQASLGRVGAEACCEAWGAAGGGGHSGRAGEAGQGWEAR